MHAHFRFSPLAAAVLMALLASCAPGSEKLIDTAGGTLGTVLRQQGMLPGATGAITHTLMGQSGTLLSAFDVSPEREAKVASYVHQQVLAKHRRSDDKELEAYLTKMVRWLAHQAGADDAMSYQAFLLEDDMLNAFTPGAGRVYVTTRLVRELKSESQMAMVLAHEVGHVLKSHPSRGLREKVVMKTALDSALAAATSSGGVDPLGKVVYQYTATAAINGHGRTLEYEADDIGLDLMVKAGYDPREAPKVFEQFLRVSGDQSALKNFLHGTHPTNKARIAKLRTLIAERYAGLDKAKVTRNSQDYVAVAQRYWH